MINVNPNRMELMKLKGRLSISKRGHKRPLLCQGSDQVGVGVTTGVAAHSVVHPPASSQEFMFIFLNSGFMLDMTIATMYIAMNIMIIPTNALIIAVLAAFLAPGSSPDVSHLSPASIMTSAARAPTTMNIICATLHSTHPIFAAAMSLGS